MSDGDTSTLHMAGTGGSVRLCTYHDDAITIHVTSHYYLGQVVAVLSSLLEEAEVE